MLQLLCVDEAIRYPCPVRILFFCAVLKLIDSLISPAIKRRAATIANAVALQLEQGQTVLDVGCGDLTVAQRIIAEIDVTITGIDTIDYNRTTLPHIIYDGSHFPVADASVDVVLFSFVLHHCTNQEELLREAVRVSRHSVIILEDVCDSAARRFVTKFYDFTANKLACASIEVPYTFRSTSEWQQAFDDNNLEITHRERLKTLLFNPCCQVLFKLRKQ